MKQDVSSSISAEIANVRLSVGLTLLGAKTVLVCENMRNTVCLRKKSIYIVGKITFVFIIFDNEHCQIGNSL